MPTLPPFPTLKKRTVLGRPLTFAEGDGNLDDIRSYALALANFIVGSFNDDGTLKANSVGATSIQAAAVNLLHLNPALLYSIVPVDDDIGTVQNAYVFTARGGATGSNIIPGGAAYDAGGNYVLTGLTLNYGYYWAKGASDASCQSSPVLTASGAFQATSTSVVLTGTPGAAVTATMVRSAPVNAYKDNQIFFIYTLRSNTGPVTLNVNNLGAIPVKQFGQQLAASAIGSPGVFCVIYKGGIFQLFGGSGGVSNSSGSSTVITTTGYNGMTLFTMPAQALAVAYPTTTQIAHGLGAVPVQFQPYIVCQTADNGYAPGQTIPLAELKSVSGGPAYAWTFDSAIFYITELAAPYAVKLSDGSTNALTIADWQLQAQASVITDFAGTAVFPALNYEIANPEGAFCFGTDLYYFSLSQYSNAGKFYINRVNMLNNEVTPVTQLASTAKLQNANGSVFAASFFGSGLPQFVMQCSYGTYKFSAQNPGTNLITPDTTYDSTGAASAAIPSAGTYVWSPASNDTSLTVGVSTYNASDAVDGRITFATGGSGTAVFAGAPNTVITATLFSATAGWTPTSIATTLANGTYKPAWVADGGATVYCVSSDKSHTVSVVDCYKVTAASALKNGAWAGSNAAALNLTSNDIVNVSAFHVWHPLSSAAPILLFQYNPITKRVYVITNETGLIHIFQLTAASNDFQAWWNTASPGRENAIKYVKSLAVSGFGTVIANWSQGHYTVDYDLATGAERALVFTRDGNNVQPGSITRVPWVE